MTKEKDLNDLTLKELEEKILEIKTKVKNVTTKKEGVWQIGKNYVIRTVTMIQIGKLIEVTPDELVLQDASWIADTGRWMNFLKEGKVNEVEPFQDDVIVGRHSIIDATVWNHKLFDAQK
jgi:intein/homing endonuclease